MAHPNNHNHVDPFSKSYSDAIDTARAERAVKDLLCYIGENADRDGLLDTPKRVAKAWKEMTCGYGEDPAKILSTTFAQNDFDEDVTSYNGMVVSRGIEMASICEHHMLPFVGQAHIVYVPGEEGRIVGLSKMARLLDCFARRLQVQERLTCQVADALQKHLSPFGVMVIIESAHNCMALRGVRKQRSTMVTSEVRGILKTDYKARMEAMALCQLGK